jgi:hypothetical protein
MDAPSFNGSDDREFGPDPDEERCDSCGAREDEPCGMWCECAHCEAEKLRQHPESA